MEAIKIRPGYACINISLEKKYKTFRFQTIENKDIQKIKKVIYDNISFYREIVEWNVKNNIYVYRVTSDIIPFCTHPYIQQLITNDDLLEKEWVKKDIFRIKELQEQYNLRLSMHPSQFIVLASQRKEVVEKSVEEINAQTAFIRRVNGANVVIHIGAAYGDKKSAIGRFKENLKYVDTSLLTIENDDKIYTSEDIATLCEERNLKWVYDYHHERCNKSTDKDIISLLQWKRPDKYHLSTGTPNSNDRPHHDYISIEDYRGFKLQLEAANISKADVIFEAKKKNQAISAILHPLNDGYWQE